MVHSIMYGSLFSLCPGYAAILHMRGLYLYAIDVCVF